MQNQYADHLGTAQKGKHEEERRSNDGDNDDDEDVVATADIDDLFAEVDLAVACDSSEDDTQERDATVTFDI